MATNGNGKLKFNLPGKDFVNRLLHGKDKQAGGEDYMDDLQPDDGLAAQDDYDARDGEYDAADDYDDYADDGYADDDGYDDAGYADDDGYADDNYADDGYDDDGYADDDGYDDDGYADDDGYDDDGYADDGYDDDRYADGGDYADDGYGDGYDDRYQDEDAGDGYYDAQQSPLMRYVDENDWVTYVLLFLLPPLGIYLLWRRNRFDKPVRWAITAASAVWFVVALILLLRGLFGGTGDQQVQPNITIPPASVEQTVAPVEDDDNGGGQDITTIDLGGGSLQDDTDENDTGDTDDTGTEDAKPSPTPLSDAASGASVAGWKNFRMGEVSPLRSISRMI